jgi:hypothetical protein
MTAQSLAFTPTTDSTRHVRLAFCWALAGALAVAALLPYQLALNPSLGARIPMPLPAFFAVQVVQGFALLLLLSWIGLRLGHAIGLDAPLARAFVYREPMPLSPKRNWAMACIIGGLAGVALIGLDKAFQPFMPAMTLSVQAPVDLWKCMLACFYGGITEELICRLFVMTLLVWILHKLSRRGVSAPATWMIWAGIAGAALLFGVGHLPAAATAWPLTPPVIARTVLLNAIGGIAFGFLYWRRGLEHAMVAHFCADIVLHVIVGT